MPMKHTYKHAMKATIVLSSAQLVEALISLIRAKIIAVLLGPVGLGINSILQTTLNTFYQLTCLGLPQSAVRDISKADSDENRQSLDRIIYVFKSIIIILAIAGMLIFLCTSPILSSLSFGRKDNHVIDFIVLSIGACFMTLSYGNITILQGTKKLMYLAKSTMYTAFLSLIVGVPFFFWLGNMGIAYAVSFSYVIAFFINSFFVKKIGINKVRIPWKEIFKIASPIIKLGITIMISSLIINLFTYFTNVLIRFFGSLHDVGLYQSGCSLTNRNFAILSAAMVADYYPRLSGLLNKKNDFDKTVTEQAELLLLIISAMSVLIIVFCPWIVKLLLSDAFLPINTLVRLIAFSFVFRIIWLTLSYVALAKGDRKTYLVYDAIIGNGSYFVLNLLFYYYGGIDGIGISCVLGTIFVSLMFLVVYGRKYNFKYEASFWKVQLICIAFVSFFMLALLINNIYIYISVITILSIVFFTYIYKALNRRLNFAQIIKDKFCR
jgi:O-antigen/teichoic acid export membrane protein